ncbi:MAG TPA: MFS transporter [Solirubrobacteraceae bacterium]|nr:MFS transporter [Solirubrobacteraceae bacterium]
MNASGHLGPDALGATRRRTFAALAVPNYRRYFIGQATSLIGTWMQMAAQSWLVLSLTGSATALGVIVALQTLPVLLLAPYGGVIADRVDKRRLMIVLQTAMGLQALALGVLTITGAVQLWEIGVLAVVLGLNNAFENPARQSFVLEMVGPDTLRNAVSLNSVQVNVARAVGPAVAGVLIATVGLGECFLINAASFVAVVVSLVTMERSALRPTPPAPRAAGQLRQGLRYAASTPEIAVPLLMMGLVGTLAYEFQVSLPVMARHALHAGAEGYGFMTSAMGLGAIVGGLVVAARGHTGLRPVTIAAVAFAVALALAALAPSMPVELIALALVGAASVSFMSTGNSTLQLAADPAMRGRVMALWFVALQGSTPIGGPTVGAIITLAGARTGLGAGALACLFAAGLGVAAQRRLRRPPEYRDAAVAEASTAVAISQTAQLG